MLKRLHFCPHCCCWVNTRTYFLVWIECFFDAVCVLLPVSKKASKGALENYPLTQTFLLCQKLHLSSQAQSRVNPHLAEACTLLKSYVKVCRESRIHTEGKTHMPLKMSHSFHLLMWLFSFMFFQKTVLFCHSVDVSSCLSSSSLGTLWMLPFWKNLDVSLCHLESL